MKAAAFDYIRAGDLAEVCRALDDGGPDCKIIAGGQTLVPMMAMRLARPSILIDINAVGELQGIGGDEASLVIKACTRQAAAERSPEVRAKAPLLAKALRFVGHPQTRNRGTVGGSIANADPVAEIPLVALTLDAGLVAESTGGARNIEISEFFHGLMETSLAPDECLTEVRFPVWNGGGFIGTGFQEVSIRAGDFAIVAAAVQLALDESGVCKRAAVALGGVAPTPVRIEATAEALISTKLDAETVHEAALLAVNEIDPGADVHASAEYRRRTARVMVERAILEARDEALGRVAKP
ncbi:MAG: xanthine dehydrogenase family protein subunit M [Proteobacteria bacterium]|nr:xanthine dehydrogenase family protein subunit M [Pseudomonadota bacterium]